MCKKAVNKSSHSARKVLLNGSVALACALVCTASQPADARGGGFGGGGFRGGGGIGGGGARMGGGFAGGSVRSGGSGLGHYNLGMNRNVGIPGNGVPGRGFGRGFGYGRNFGYGYGYGGLINPYYGGLGYFGNGFDWTGEGGQMVSQPIIDNSRDEYTRKQDERRAKLNASETVKTYRWK